MLIHLGGGGQGNSSSFPETGADIKLMDLK